MVITQLVGAGLLTFSIAGMLTNTPKAYLKRAFRHTLSACKLDGVKIQSLVRTDPNTFKMEIALPYGMSRDQFEKHLTAFEQSAAAKIRFKHVFGSTFSLTFGLKPLHETIYYDAKLQNGLAVPLHTTFGIQWLDFQDETSCHLLVGGATRMGKSAFLRLVVAHILNETDGKVQMVLANNKVSDLYMFRSIPQVTIAETVAEANAALTTILAETAKRKEQLKQKGDVVDVRQFRERYPDEPMEPIFIIIDEYGRFADDDMFQEKVIEIAETAGYLDVHLVLSAQRPDAKDVLKPRIKANIVTRLSFATSDETNSRIILDTPDAAHIGKIQGRAILLDGVPEEVQVPYVSADDAELMVRRFKQNDRPRQDDISDAQPLPGFVTGSDWEPNLPRSRKTARHGKPNRKKTPT